MSWTLGDNLENLTLTGSANLNGTGNSEDNVITGNSGANTLTGGTGADTLDGGAGNDTVNYSAAAGGVAIDLYGQVAPTDGDGGSDSFTSIENVVGSSYNDFLSGSAGANVLDGGAGDDMFWAGAGADTLTLSLIHI